MRRLCGSLLILLLGSCKVGPNYIPPAAPVCDDWVAPDADEDMPDPEWWQKLNDQQLSELINAAYVFNNDLKVAEANVLQARALIQVSAADLFPKLSADLNALHTHLSRNGIIDLISSPNVPTTVTPPGLPQNINLYTAILDASWEIDLFGKTRRGIENSRATYEAQIEYRNGVLLSLIAEVARDYVQLRSAQKNWELVSSNIDLLEKNAQLMRNRFNSGLANNLDLQRIEAELAVALGTRPPIVAQIYQYIYALSVLTGTPPETLICALIDPKPLPETPCELELGVRSEILRRRPDIRQAERQLAAATANVGVAVANFYPSLTLRGFFGLQSVKLHNLFKPDSKTWLDTGTLSLPIFQGGLLVGNLKATEAAMVAAGYNYQQTVLNALEEAEGALVAYTQDQLAAQQQEEAVRRTAEVSRLSNNRLQSGLINLTDWLDSERQLISSQQTLLTTQTQTLLDMIKLYKALGGGWESFCDGEETTAPCEPDSDDAAED